MVTSKFQEDMNRKIKSNYPIMLVVSYEWRRVQGIVIKASKQANKDVYWWTNTSGIKKWDMDEREWEME